jgi:hypothetical protein
MMRFGEKRGLFWVFIELTPGFKWIRWQNSNEPNYHFWVNLESICAAFRMNAKNYLSATLAHNNKIIANLILKVNFRKFITSFHALS